MRLFSDCNGQDKSHVLRCCWALETLVATGSQSIVLRLNYALARVEIYLLVLTSPVIASHWGLHRTLLRWGVINTEH
jgi:hypothetical protein